MSGSAPFTAIVVTYNEAARLRACLESLAFCRQLLVVDLGSSDDCVAIAQSCGAQVLRHARVPVVEQVRAFAAAHARHDWLLFMDPDEVILPALAEQLQDVVARRAGAGSVEVPWQFYFRGKALHCCVWGQPGYSKQVLFHRERVELRPLVHRGYRLLEGFRAVTVERSGENYIQHYWIDSYRELFAKHRRYLTQEGPSRYAAGQRFSWGRLALYTVGALKMNLIDYDGWRCGFTGVFLSLFHGWYMCRSWLALRAYQRSRREAAPA